MMNGMMSLAVLQEGLTAREVLDNIPTDPVSIFVYLLLALIVGWVVWGSRKKGNPVG